jgi:general stress protein YciG
MAEFKDPGRVEGGRKAAKTAKQRYGNDFHREIGARGGRITANRHGEEFFETIGRKGGQSKSEM